VARNPGGGGCVPFGCWGCSVDYRPVLVGRGVLVVVAVGGTGDCRVREGRCPGGRVGWLLLGPLEGGGDLVVAGLGC
jgi:hypothetical protein